MADLPAHESPPDEVALARLATAIKPDATVVGCSRLAGGIDNACFRLDMRMPDGASGVFTLRRQRGWDSLPAPVKAEREWHVLELLQRLGVDAPRPVLNDSTGSISGHPGLILTYVEGSPNLTPADTEAWARELARPLAYLHTKSAGMKPNPYLPQSEEWIKKKDDGPSQRESTHPLAGEVWSKIRCEFGQLVPVTNCLLHFDYYPGNTIWSGERLVAVIDWDGASIGDPAYDVAYARLDLCLQGRFEAADHFLDEYERLVARTVENLHYYELLVCLRAMSDPSDWLPGWNSYGMTLTAEDVRENLSKYIEQVLHPPFP